MHPHIRITQLNSRGNGLGKHGGSTYELPFVLKGEVVEAKPIQQRRKHVLALPVHIDKASSLRRKADCPHFGTCSSCHFKHLSYADSKKLKLEMFRSMLEKEVSFWNMSPTDRDHLYALLSIKYGQSKEYRNQCRFYAQQGKLFQRSMLTHELFPVTTCTVISESMLRLAKALAKKLPKGCTEFEIRENTNKEQLCTIFGEHLPKGFSFPVHSLFFYNTKDHTFQHLAGKETLTFALTIQEHTFHFQTNASSFFQVHTEIAEKLYSHIIDLLPSTGLVWDYFSGTGTIGIIAGKLHPHLQVEGIEVREEMVQLASINASLNGVENFTSQCANLTQHVLEKKSPRTIVVDPPRNGLGKHLCEEICEVASPDIIYVSCNPTTFFEDMRILSKAYLVKSITLYDMMPFTSHTELVAHLTLRNTQ